MKSKFAQTLLAGLIATGVMTIIGLMAPYMGLPRMNPAQMLSGMIGVSAIAGWAMHFLIGIIFAAAYVYFFNLRIHISSKILKGALFGLAVFIFAQVMMFVIGKMMPMAMIQGDMMLMMAGSLIGHLVYGIVVAGIVSNFYIEQNKNRIRTAHA